MELYSGNTMPNLDEQLRQAREISWKRFGRRLTVYLPGMFSYSGLSGDYPAVSITGSDCALQCDHCRGIILEPMVSAMEPDILVQKGLGIAKNGNQGILISGGCDPEGRLPWKRFIPAIKEIKEKTELYISIHCGLVDEPVASDLKGAGVDQALIDVIGDDETYQRIYHVNFGISRIEDSMGSLQKAGIPIVPHIVCGLHFGEIRGERKAIEMISRFHVEQVVIVSLMTIPGTPLWGVHTPEPEEIAQIIAETRFAMPGVRMSLGCARKRGDVRSEILAIDGGINRMALPSEEALRHAEKYGLEIRYQRTCCSVSKDVTHTEW